MLTGSSEWKYLQDANKALMPNTTMNVSSSGSYISPVGIQSNISGFSFPEYEQPAPYVAPEYDKKRIEELTQETAAPAVRGLRSAMQRVAGSSSDNPNVAKMTLRSALAGYGEGLQSAMSAASNTAKSLYNQEYGVKSDEAKTNYGTALNTAGIKHQAKMTEATMKYQAMINDYMKKTYDTQQSSKSATTVSPTRYGGTIPSGSGGSMNKTGQYLDYEGKAIK